MKKVRGLRMAPPCYQATVQVHTSRSPHQTLWGDSQVSSHVCLSASVENNAQYNYCTLGIAYCAVVLLPKQVTSMYKIPKLKNSVRNFSVPQFLFPSLPSKLQVELNCVWFTVLFVSVYPLLSWIGRWRCLYTWGGRALTFSKLPGANAQTIGKYNDLFTC